MPGWFTPRRRRRRESPRHAPAPGRARVGRGEVGCSEGARDSAGGVSDGCRCLNRLCTARAFRNHATERIFTPRAVAPAANTTPLEVTRPPAYLLPVVKGTFVLGTSSYS